MYDVLGALDGSRNMELMNSLVTYKYSRVSISGPVHVWSATEYGYIASKMMGRVYLFAIPVKGGLLFIIIIIDYTDYTDRMI